MFLVEELLRCGNPCEWVSGICKKPQPKPQRTPCREKLKSISMPTVKHKALHFMLYWVSIYYLISACKRLQLKQKDISKYLTPFFLYELSVELPAAMGFWLKREKKDWFKMWSVGVLQSRIFPRNPRGRRKERKILLQGDPESGTWELLLTGADLGGGWGLLAFLRWKPELFALCKHLPFYYPVPSHL